MFDDARGLVDPGPPIRAVEVGSATERATDSANEWGQARRRDAPLPSERLWDVVVECAEDGAGFAAPDHGEPG